MNHNDFREIIDDAPETGADTIQELQAADSREARITVCRRETRLTVRRREVRLPVQKMWRSMRAHQAPER